MLILSLGIMIYRLYRASVLFFLESDLLQELAWLDEISLQHLKNYQIWYVT